MNRIMQLRSRMESGPAEEDHSNYICICDHKLSEHDWPAGRCLVEGCNCREFTRYIEGYYDDEIN
jgi:hypothetical protein